MAINSIIFWFAFIAVLLPYFTVLRHSAKAQNVWLLAASYAIYGYADWRMLPLLLAVTVFYYFLAPAIARNRQTNARRATTLSTVGIVVGVGVLWWFKYLNFCIEQFTELFNSAGIGASTSTMKIIMPVGISFFTFKLISYTIEVRRGNIQPERNFINFGTYVAFFPTIMSGPIDRPKPFLDQLRHNHLANSTDLSEGAKRVLWGFFLKMCIANRICIYTDSVFNHCFFHNGTTLIVASVLYLIQMYTDFSGYSHMAVGVSRMMGIRVMENFQQPFFAQNVADFWRRWHISLSSWLRDYIYIPMGGRRCSVWRCHYNTLVTFVVCGIWHGANWTFIAWGAYHAFLFLPLILLGKNRRYRDTVATITLPDGTTKSKMLPSFREAAQMLFTFTLAVFGWIIFRVDTITDAGAFLMGICNKSLISIPWLINRHFYIPLACAIVCMFLVEWVGRLDTGSFLSGKIRYKSIRWIVYLLLIAAIARYGGFEQVQFIYFQF